MNDQASLGDISGSGDSEERSINEEVPEGWKKKKLDNLLDTLISGDRPTGGGLDEGDYISLGGTQINSNGRIELEDVVYIEEDFFEKVSETQLRKHDVLMTKDGAKTGEVAIAWEDRPDIVTNEHVLTMRMKEEINQPYAFYYLYSHEGWKQIHGTITGSAQEGINMGFAGKVDIKYPEKDEQRRIASVLHNVDQAISKTEEIIEQTQRVKKGLMQDLFTEGYYNHEEYQDRDLWINMCQKAPRDWEVVKAEEAMTIRRGASPRPKSDSSLFGGDIPWIKIGDVEREKSHFVTETVDTVTEKGKSKSEFVEEGALLVANSGATCGFSILAGKDGCVHDGWLILEDYEPFNKKYLLHFVNWHQDFLQSLAPGSAQTNLNTNRFGLLDLPKPPKEEQEKIAEALDSLDESMFQNRELISQLQRLKNGLMQDLLTGSVRTGEDVRVLDEVVV